MKSKCFLMVAGLILVLFSYSFAQVPQLINYQGKLTKSTGAPLDTTISMIFSIYADSAGTILKWTETQGAVVVEKSIFNVLLGNVNPIPDTVFNGNIRYLGVTVGGDPEIIPRKPMVSVAYAYRSATGAGDNDWTINGDTIYHLNGNVGIGTTSPSDMLHVAGTIRANQFRGPLVVNGGNITYAADGGDHIFTTATLERMRLTVGGNVGIGTTSPGKKLDVSGDIRASGETIGAPGSGHSQFRAIAGNYGIMLRNDGTDTYFLLTASGDQYGAWNTLRPFTINDANGNVGIGNNTLYVVHDGNVGIGTTTPNEQVELTGNLRLPASTSSVGVIKSGANRFIHNFGASNFFAGVNAGNFTLSGNGNTGVGSYALQALTTGYQNTAVGAQALYYNTTGYYNTAVGTFALRYNTTGNYNTGVGYSAFISNTTGGFNTAMGYAALDYNTTGTNNTAIGYGANVSSGGLYNATAIGYNAIVDASSKVRIGNTAVTSIGGQVGWTTFSDGRYKKSISENVPGLDFISKLKPVTYTMDVDAIDAVLNASRKPREGQTEDAFKLSAEEIASKQAQSQKVYTGFIAQEVEKAARETGYDFSGVDAPKNAEGMYGLRYAEFVVPLVKAVQEQQESIKEQQQTIKEQQKQIKMLEQRIAELEKK